MKSENFLCQYLLITATLLMLSGAGLTSAVVAAEDPEVDNRNLEADIKLVQDKLEALEATVKDGEAGNSQLMDTYQSVLSDLQAAMSSRQEARQLEQQVSQVPEITRELEQELRALPQDIPDTAFQSLSLEELDARLTQEQTELNGYRLRLNEIEAEQEWSIQQAITRTRVELENLPAKPRGTGSDELMAAKNQALAARRMALTARVSLLERRLLSRDALASVNRIRSQLLTRKIKLAEQRTMLLQARLNKRRQSGAERSVAAARAMARQMQDQPEVIREYAAENVKIAQQIEALVEEIDEVVRRTERVQVETTRITRAHDSLSRQLQIAGLDLSADFGVLLRQQRAALPELAVHEAKAEANRRNLVQARLLELRVNDRQITDPQAAAAELAAEAANGAPAAPLVPGVFLPRLVEARQQLLAELQATNSRYISALAVLDVEETNLLNNSREYAALLDERLFWVPSAQPVDSSTLTSIGRSLLWLFSPANWQQAGKTAMVRINERPLLALLLAALPALLFWKRRQLIGNLKAMDTRVGKVGKDQFRLTLVAMFISLLLALPGALILAVLAWVLKNPGTFSGHLAMGLWDAAALLVLLSLFINICRRGGIAEVHFRWKPTTLSVVKRNFRWLMAVLIPLAVLTAMTEASPDSNLRDGLGRLIFCIASIALALFAHRVLRPGRGALASLAEETTSSRRWQLRYILHPAAVVLPIALMLLALFGYHYTALHLEEKLFVTAWVLVAGVLVYYLVLRAIAVSERRLALKRLREKRERDRAAQLAADSTAETIPEVTESDEIDLVTISDQSRALVRMLISVGVVAVLWLLWADVFPALGVFNEISLWQVTESVGGVDEAIDITLQSVLMAVLAGFITFFAARNLPGTLEVAFLNRVKLAPGTSYAVTTIIRYIIVIVGVVVAFNLIGAQWSKVQWLVAALGVGLGFGLQEIVANFISGILILFERPIRVGDTVTVGGETGTVSRIRIRATTITDWDRKELLIPNKTFITEQLTNWTLSDPINRLIINVGVAYGSNVELVEKLLMEVAENNPKVAESPSPQVFFVRFGDSSLDFEVRVFISSMMDLMPLTHEIHMAIDRTFRENGIEIPFPQRDLHFRTVSDKVIKAGQDMTPGHVGDTKPSQAPGKAPDDHGD